jgi:hypothetical protein
MAYHDDLIKHAIFLSELDLKDDPKQVDLPPRRFSSILRSFPFAHHRSCPELEAPKPAESICQNV